NGRVARCLATIVLLRAGRFPLVLTRDHREEYIIALEHADQGDLGPLVRLFNRIEKRAYIQALSLSEDVLATQTPMTSLIDSIATRYQERRNQAQGRVFKDVAQRLRELAVAEFERLTE